MKPAHSRSGFTLVEVAIVATVASIVLGAIGLFQVRTNESFRHASALNLAQTRTHRALERVLIELWDVGLTTLVPDPTTSAGGSTFTYQVSLGVDGAGSRIWSTQRRLDLALDDGEVDNGVDDDGDGVIDERRLVITYGWGTLNARVVTLAHDLPELDPDEQANAADDNANGIVDERGFNVRRVGNLLTVRLTSLAHSSNGQITSWTESSGIRIRN